MNRGGFSWKRFLGISAFKSKISRHIGIPLTRGGRQRKMNAWIAKLAIVFIVMVFSLLVTVFYKIKNVVRLLLFSYK